MSWSLLRALALFAALLAPTAAVGCGADADAQTASAKHAIDAGVATVKVGKATLGGTPGCWPTERTVTFDRATLVMTWPACASSAPAGSGGTPYAEVTRTLTAAEASRVEAALAALTYVENPSCSAYDGLDYFMDATSKAGAVVQYSAYNVNCYGYRQAAGLPSLYALFEELRG